MFTQPTQTRTDQNEYRLVWNCLEKRGTQYGTFLFNDLMEAIPALSAMRKRFPDYVIWLEDREHNRIKI